MPIEKEAENFSQHTGEGMNCQALNHPGDVYSQSMYTIENAKESDYADIVDVWEASVRATHSFVTDEDITEFKPLILGTYLKAVELRCIRDKGRIIGFLGVADENIEMLFLHPDFIGRGIGKRLVDYAIMELKAKRVDVNEQNPNAWKFYERAGFKVVGRSELDPTGRPYPILHMKLEG
jgi:putative acetyltransferase